MNSFKDNILKEYGKSITELSKTGNGNFLVDNDFIMISLDDMASNLSKGNILSTTDALFIDEKNEVVHFIEFKNIDFNNEEDKLMARFHLNKAIDVIKDCEHDCPLVNDKSKFHKYLVDKYQLALRTKPFDSISLIYDYLCNYCGDDKLAKENLVNVKKYFWLVSKTNYEFNSPFLKNRQNNHRRNKKEFFNFLSKLKPYFYSDVFAVSTSTFQDFINKLVA